MQDSFAIEDEFTRAPAPPAFDDRRQGAAFYRRLGELGMRDPFIFMKVILGYDWMEEYHYHWIQRYLYYRDRNMLRLYSRGTGKSTVHTIGFALWEAVRKPTIRQIIVNNREKNAVAFLRTIRQHLKYNLRFKMCYPHLQLAKDDQTEIVFILAEKDPRPEPSIAAIGVRGNLVSAHWDIMHLDDIVSDKDMLSNEIREGTKVWFEAAQSLLNVGGRFSITGTPWHLDDLYAKIREDNRLLEEHRRYVIDVQGATNMDGSLAYPTVYPVGRLRALRETMGVGLYNSQVLCKPQPAETQLFSYDTVKLFDHRTNKNFYHGFYLYLDPATGKKGDVPGMDYNALVAGGLSPDGTLDIMRALLLRAKPSKICQLILQLHREYHFDGVIVESNGFQEMIADELDRLATAKGMGLTVHRMTNSKSKTLRISSIEPIWLRGYLRLRDDLVTFVDPLTKTTSYHEFMEQVVGWPVAAHDDAPDALASLCRAVKYLFHKVTIEEQLNVAGKGGIDAEAIAALRYSVSSS